MVIKKITDRFLVGVIAGLGGNIAKMAVEQIASRTIGFSETGSRKAASIFVKEKDLDSTLARVVGYAADNLIAGMLGITCSYWFTLMGKDYHLLKGAGIAAMEWTGLWGVVSSMGSTSISRTSPKDELVSLASHLAFGATKAQLLVSLGDPSLFAPSNLELKAKGEKAVENAGIGLTRDSSGRLW